MRCAYSVIDKVIDRFGEDIRIIPISDDEFEITEAVAVGSTFYSWIFNYGGRIKIVAPHQQAQGGVDAEQRHYPVPDPTDQNAPIYHPP